MKKFLDETEQFILGIFVGCILMITVFVIITGYEKFTDTASTLISCFTLLSAIMAGRKVLKWYEIKRNDKAFANAENIVISTYNCYTVLIRLEKTIDELNELIKASLLSHQIKKQIKTILLEEKKEFLRSHSIANTSKMSLTKWETKTRDSINEPLNEIIVLFDFIRSSLINATLSNFNIDLFHRNYNTIKEKKSELKIIMDEYNKLTIDDIYEFKK